MAVGLGELPELIAVEGVRLGYAKAGIKKPDRKDIVLIEMDERTRTAAVFTRNAFCAAPVTLSKEHLSACEPRYLLINTGNANAGTGVKGYEDASESCHALASLCSVNPDQVLPFSTGVIGEPLPVAKIKAGLPEAVANLRADGWVNAAHGIMTTDTLPKGFSRRYRIGQAEVTFTGISKGAGMIKPNMATMLAFIATDARIESGLLQTCLSKAADKSFNRITIDGDTSTNDSCVLMATQFADMPEITSMRSEEYRQFSEALTEVCQQLAQAIVRDGEGATKFITVDVVGGVNGKECEEIGFTIAHSPLVKTAFFACDPNWGRILAALGRANVPGLNLERVKIYLDEVCIVENGGRSPSYTEEQGQKVMKREEITIRVNLGRGEARETMWTCDFSYDYVRINAEYRS